jgi:hypothetical protein
MLIRIVKLEFEKDKLKDFLAFFETIKESVNSFEGCFGMKLLQDVSNPYIIMTYSHWEDKEALNKYRDSALFGKVWPTIKPWFSAKPEAWSMGTYFDGFNTNKLE